MSSANPWPPEKIEKFRQLWLSGWSGGEIAQLLGITRSAVMGKIHRLGIGRAAAPGKISERIRGNTNSRGYKYPRRPDGRYRQRRSWDPPDGSCVISFRDIEADQCRYIAGEADEWDTLMCGHPTILGAYCGYHHRLCHQKQRTYPPGALLGTSPVHPPVSGEVPLS